MEPSSLSVVIIMVLVTTTSTTVRTTTTIRARARRITPATRARTLSPTAGAMAGFSPTMARLYRLRSGVVSRFGGVGGLW
jgi:hypothetical protein